jgi:hypothetical protein
MKYQLSVFALICASLMAPANAAVTPKCTYGGSQITSATNGAIVIVSAVDNACIFTPLAVGSVGQVLTSNGANTLPSFAAGGGGGPTLAGNNTWTGTNTYTNAAGANFGTPGVNSLNSVNIAEGVGGSAPYLNIGATNDPSWGCLGLLGTTGIFLDQNDGVFMEFDAQSSLVGFCSGFRTASIDSFGVVRTRNDLVVNGRIIDGSSLPGTSGQVLSSTGSATAWVTPPVSSANTATILLGQTGAPAGACVNGSIYTRSEGGAGSTLYGCYSATWHAATTP